MSFGVESWLWLALLGPVAALVAAWLWRRRFLATEQWVARGLWHRLNLDFGRGRMAASIAGLTVCLIGTAVSLAQPRWGMIEEKVDRQGVDIVFLLDSSLSMATQDVTPSRIAVARSLIRNLVQRLPEHRVALVQVEGEGQVMAPLTVDGAVIDLLLDAVAPATLPTPGTRLAPALDQALQLFPAGDTKHRVIVLVSDGEDHGGGLEELAAKLKSAGVMVHALGIGTLQGGPIPLPGSDAYKRSAEGEVVISKLDEKPLEELAGANNGIYLRVSGGGADLSPLLAEIDRMDRRSLSGETLVSHAEQFQWPLAFALLALLAHLITGVFAPKAEARR